MLIDRSSGEVYVLFNIWLGLKNLCFRLVLDFCTLDFYAFAIKHLFFFIIIFDDTWVMRRVIILHFRKFLWSIPPNSKVVVEQLLNCRERKHFNVRKKVGCSSAQSRYWSSAPTSTTSTSSSASPTSTTTRGSDSVWGIFIFFVFNIKIVWDKRMAWILHIL